MNAPALTVLTASPALGPLLLRGALRSPFKRPAPGAEFARTRLVLPGVRVDLARLAAYERVCGFPTGDDSLPVTYPHVLGFPTVMRLMSGPGFPLPLLGLVHTSIEITRHRALPASGTYELTAYVEGLAPHRRGTEATLVTEARSGDELVWASRSTYLARHTTKSAGTSTGTASRTGAGRGTGTDTGTDAPLPLPVLAEWQLAGDVGRRYAAASGDRNPIHLYPLTARLFGFPRPIAHGMWTVARCLAAHGTPDAVSVRAEFTVTVPLPGTVTYAARDGRFELRGERRAHLVGEVRPLGNHGKHDGG